MRFLLGSMLGLLLLAAAIEPAEARRIRFPIPIPGFSHGSGDQLVRVLELPRIAELQREDGTPIDLGYLFHRDGTGEWIGHVGSGRQYLKLKPEMLPFLMTLAGRSELPPIPERPTGSTTSASGGSFGAFWWLLIVFGIGAFVVRMAKRGVGAGSRVVAGVAQAVASTSTGATAAYDKPSAWMEKAAKSMETRAATAASAPGVARPSAPVAAASARPRPMREPRGMALAGPAARPAFGRRG